MQFFEFFHRLQKGNVESGEINTFIEKCCQIGTAYVNTLHNQSLGKFRHLNLSAEDIVIDAIVPLILPKKGEQFYAFLNGYNKWKPPVSDEGEAFYFVTCTITSRIDQHITDLLKEADPFFKKIHKMLMYQAKLNNLTRAQYFGVTYLVRKKQRNIEGGILTEEELDKIPIESFLKKEMYLDNLLSYVSEELSLFPALPVNALVDRLKRIYLQIDIDLKQKEQISGKLAVDDYLETGRKAADDKIRNLYIKKKKISVKEAESFRVALEAVLLDMRNGGIAGGLYEYFEPYSKNVSKSEYEKKYHNKFEYLIKVMKSAIAQKIDKDM